MPFLGRSPGSKFNTNVMLDAITTSATATYALTKDSAAYTPKSVQTLLVSLNGVTQAPTAAYTISGSNIVFSSALTSNDVIDYIISFEGDVTSITTSAISAGDIATSMLADDAVTTAKMAANSVDSDQYVDGSIDLAHMSSESVDEDNLYISNSGSNGQVLTKQSGNAGGLTWATVGGAYSDWTILTTTANLAAKGQYICNHASTAFTVTLPAASESGNNEGDTVIVANAGAATVTIARNSSKINSADADGTLPQGNSVQLVYVDDTIGWFEV